MEKFRCEPCVDIRADLMGRNAEPLVIYNEAPKKKYREVCMDDRKILWGIKEVTRAWCGDNED